LRHLKFFSLVIIWQKEMVFLTYVAYDYFKSYVNLFIETNGVPETIFGKPPMQYILPLLNFCCFLESFCFALFLLFVFIQLLYFQNLFAVCAPLMFLFALYAGAMQLLFLYWAFNMFRYATSIGWVFCFMVMLPMIYIMQTLAFCAPLLVTIVFPIQHATNLWQNPQIWDFTLYLILALAGMTLKGFIRPSEDEENPYSHQVTSVPVTVAYFFELLLLAIWLFVLTCQLDVAIPWFGSPFVAPSWWIIWIPGFVAVLLGMLVFSVKGFLEWKSYIKFKDPNGDSLYQACFYTGLDIFLVFVGIASILACCGSQYNNVPWPVVVVFLIFAYLTVIGVSLLPFFNFFQKRQGKARREMLCAL